MVEFISCVTFIEKLKSVATSQKGEASPKKGEQVQVQ